MIFIPERRKNKVVKQILLLFLTLLTLQPQTLFGQDSNKLTISGKVIDDNGFSIPGVTIQNKTQGGKFGTVTDENGKFTLKVESKDVILFSFIGFEKKEIDANKIKNATIVLSEENKELNEVVVIGYGTTKKKDFTGSVSSIKSDELTINNPVNVAQGLQGKMAGVQIIQSDGAPGANVSILIRGANSFSTNSTPLVVVDGIPFDGSLSALSPNDIESMDILKDASATAIYGSRGANGVVLVTTKRNVGDDKIQFSSTFSVAKLNPTFKVLDAHTYALKQNETSVNDALYNGIVGTSLPYPEVGTWIYQDWVNHTGGYFRPSPDDFYNPRVVKDAYGNSSVINNTDWINAISRVGATQQYDLSINGGNDKGNHSVSVGYLNQKGTLIGTSYERYTARLTLNRKVKKWLEIGVNANFSNELTDLARDQVAGGAGGGLIRSSFVYPPDRSILDVDKEETLAYLAYNPLTYLNNQINRANKIWVGGSTFLQIQIAKGLKFRQNLGYSYQTDKNDNYSSRKTWGGSSANGINGIATRYNAWNTGTTFESVLTYDKVFKGIHKLNVVGGITYERRDYGNSSMQAQNFSDDLTLYYNMGKATQINSISSTQSQTSLVSFLGRANYTLLDKYLLTATFRRDGSSKFAINNKYANFMSGAFAWRASEEKWIKNLKIFNDLKFRLSYGETGNQGINPYETLPRVNPANTWINNGEVNGYAVTGPVDPNLVWETTAQRNIGLDVSFLKGRIGFVVDYYHKKTRDLLQNLSIPLSTGFTTLRTNYGTVTNDGLEISSNFQLIAAKDWSWKMNANISFNQNRLGDLKGDQFAQRVYAFLTNASIQRNGYAIGTLYGYVADGFYDNLAEVRADPQYASVSDIVAKKQIGEQKYRDLNGDGRITELSDRTVIGDVNPDYVYGITNTFSWENFSLSIFFQGTQGNDILNANKVDMNVSGGGNLPDFVYNARWTPETVSTAQYPKLQGADRNKVFSSAFIEDGSYLRLKNVSLSYNIDKPFRLKGIRNVKVSLSGANLFTWTKYSWLDPDVSVFGSDISRRGVDMYAYPSSRTLTFALNATF